MSCLALHDLDSLIGRGTVVLLNLRCPCEDCFRASRCPMIETSTDAFSGDRETQRRLATRVRGRMTRTRKQGRGNKDEEQNPDSRHNSFTERTFVLFGTGCFVGSESSTTRTCKNTICCLKTVRCHVLTNMSPCCEAPIGNNFGSMDMAKDISRDSALGNSVLSRPTVLVLLNCYH